MKQWILLVRQSGSLMCGRRKKREPFDMGSGIQILGQDVNLWTSDETQSAQHEPDQQMLTETPIERVECSI